MADNSNELVNPLYGLQVGSTIKSSNSRFGPSVIELPITKMTKGDTVERSMTGSSSYVYTDKMNQGSIGVSGAYGVSGISKFNSAVSAYLGNSSAGSSKTVNVDYNVKMVSGIEYIDFDSLSTTQLVAALKAGPKGALLEALGHFTALKSKVQSTELLYRALENPAQHADISVLIAKWVGSVTDFFEDYGDGLVVGVLWGGLGTVSLKMESSAGESNWKYGGKGNFTYSGASAAVSVAAAYDGSQSKKDSSVKVSATSWASGRCVQSQVADWSKTVEGKAFAEICDLKLLEKAPGLDKVPPPPAVPEFKVPKTSDEKIASKFKELTTLDGLEAFAVASAYDKAKKEPGNEHLSLQEFMERAKHPANQAPAQELAAEVADNDLDVFDYIGDNPQDPDPAPLLRHAAPNPATPTLEAGPKVAADTKPTTDDYTPLGTWIANWADLFPWLATGYLNEMTSGGAARAALRKQCMVQDMLTLSHLYDTFATSSIQASELGMDESFEQVADSFRAALASLRARLQESDAIEQALKKLSSDARAIYKCWNDNSFLRNAELGLGLAHNGQYSVLDEIARTQPTTTSPTVFYKCGKCKRGPADSNTVFKSFLKVIPLLTPAGAIYAFGPSNMLLKSVSVSDKGDEFEAGFTRRVVTALKLTPNATLKVLQNDKTILYPIRFEDAQGQTDWKGQVVSTNLSANKPLANQIQQLQAELKKLKVYSFSSANWSATADWKPDKPYRRSALHTQYYGITDPIGSIFEA